VSRRTSRPAPRLVAVVVSALLCLAAVPAAAGADTFAPADDAVFTAAANGQIHVPYAFTVTPAATAGCQLPAIVVFGTFQGPATGGVPQRFAQAGQNENWSDAGEFPIGPGQVGTYTWSVVLSCPSGMALVRRTFTVRGAGAAPPTAGGSGCVVPSLRGKKLARARALLTAAGCRTGRVLRKRSSRRNRGRVISQTRAPGARLPSGTAVGLVVGKR
jgi:hypothetical protein